eukprot:12804211-Alexandrium_andersonii.AAC.1
MPFENSIRRQMLGALGPSWRPLQAGYAPPLRPPRNKRLHRAPGVGGGPDWLLARQQPPPGVVDRRL